MAISVLSIRKSPSSHWDSLLQPSFSPALLLTAIQAPSARESCVRAPENLGKGLRNLLCRQSGNDAVSCEEEEFEIGCWSTPSSGGVWRNASWGYIKHWLMLRHHEFWKLHLRDEQNLRLHITYKPTGTRDMQDLWESGLSTGYFWSPATTAWRKWEPYVSNGGRNLSCCYSRKDWTGILALPIGEHCLSWSKYKLSFFFLFFLGLLCTILKSKSCRC